VVTPTPCGSGGCTSNAAALNVIAPPAAPTVTSVSPASVALGGAAFTLTVNGTNFVGTSVVQVDGASRVTTLMSATQVTAQLPASDRATGGTHTITVLTPAPGGGTSGGATLTVTGPTITVNLTSVMAGGTLTFALTNGSGNPRDALTLHCPATSADVAYLDYAFMNNMKSPGETGVTGATLTLVVPATVPAGTTCQARWFANASAGTLPPIAVSPTVTTQ
jgi:hypothetical protein